MFEKEKCKNCGEKVKDNWQFCPHCGKNLKEIEPFEDMEKEFKKLSRIGLPKVFTKPTRGITITISTGRPGFGVKTRRIEPQMRRKVEEVKKPIRIAKLTEEPETKVNRMGQKEIIQIKLPEVRSLDDIEVRRLEQSVEIRAFAGDKAYFKLIPISSGAEILRKEFKDNVLKIEVIK